MVRVHAIAAALAAVALAVPATAAASTVRVDGVHAFFGGTDQHFTYIADPGEVNDVTVSTQSTGTFSHDYDIEDPGAVIFLPPSMLENPPGAEDPTCQRFSDHHVRCSSKGKLGHGAHTTVRLGDMDDEIRITPEVETRVEGGPGDDVLSVSGWVDDLFGGDGDDTLITTDEFADRLFGEAGNDTLRTSQPLDRTDPDGGPGIDTFDFSNRTGNVTATAGATETDTVDGYPGIESFIGGSGDDSLTGDEGPNSLTGGPGRDALSGLGGDDTFDPAGVFLFAGNPPAPTPSTDRDVVTGGAGTDHVTYAARTADMSLSLDGVANDGVTGEGDNLGTDVENLTGGGGEDVLIGSALANVLDGGAGTVPDSIDGEGGTDTVSYQGRGSDLAISLDGLANDGAAGESDDLAGDIENAWGGHGDDTIVGSSPRGGGIGLPIAGGNNELRGGAGSDTLDGLAGNDVLLGDGFPIAFLAFDDDTLLGGTGNDRLQGDTAAFGFFIRGADTFKGGTGTDLADYSDRSGNLTLTLPDGDLALPPADDGEPGENDALNGDVENIALGSGADSATGNGGPNTIDATTGGADSLAGAGGADTLLAGPAADALSGGPGADSITSGAGPGTTTIDGGDDGDTLVTGTGRDVVGGGPGVDLVSYAARPGPVRLTIGDGLTNDGSTFSFQDDDVQADVENAVGSPHADTLTGSVAPNVLDGGAGTDTITGGEGADTLLGGTENDHLKSVDGSADSDDCGAGTADKVTKDALDAATGCELVAPANTAPPAISGTERDGEVLTAAPGTWSGTDPIAFAYQWRRCDGSGGACADLTGATAASYTVVPADVGSTLRVRVTASNPADATPAESAPTGEIEPAPPANGSPPTVSGTAMDSKTLTADPGAWSGTPPLAFEFQWRRCAPGGGACADIPGATGRTRDLTPEDIGSELRVRVTASNTAPDPVTADSGPTAEVAPAPPVNSSPPVVSGDAQAGKPMTATPGVWSGTPAIAFAYQWLSCDADATDSCAEIPGATTDAYTPGAAEVARRLRVRVTASNTGGDMSADSGASRVVVPAGGATPAGPGPGGGGSGGGGGGGGGGTTPPGGEPPDAAAPAVGLSLGGLAFDRVLRRGLVVFVQLSEPASVSARLELARRAARGLGIIAAARPVTIGKGRAKATAPGRLRVVVKLNRRARKRLAKASRVRLVLRLTARDAAGNAARTRRAVILKR